MINPKQELYDNIEVILKNMGITKECYPIDSARIVKSIPNLYLEYLPYKSSSLGAIMLRGDITGIAVNANNSSCDQNFDIAHELIHYWLHHNVSSINLDMPSKSQNRIKEWQANEGAAQLLMPHWDFTPRFLDKAKEIERTYESVENIYYDLAKYYNVSPIVIDYRIRNLDSEILQYHSGVSIEDIKLSGNIYVFNKQKKAHIYKGLLDSLKARNG